MKISKIALTIIVVACIGAVVLAAKAVVRVKAPPARKSGVTGRTLGNPAAAVKVVEFTDFQCPACAHAARFVHAQLESNGGRIALELKYFPLAMHKNARRAAVIAECALQQARFWPMHDVLFASQDSWGPMSSPDDYFLSLARSLGLDDVKLMRCMTDTAMDRRVAEDMREGQGLGVRATPTFFVNGKMFVGVGSFVQALKEALP